MIDADFAQRQYLGATEVLAVAMPKAIDAYAALVNARANGVPTDAVRLQEARELVRTSCWAMSVMVQSFEQIIDASELVLTETQGQA